MYLGKASTRGTFLKVFSGVESFCFGLRVSGIGPRRFRFAGFGAVSASYSLQPKSQSTPPELASCCGKVKPADAGTCR